MVGTAGPEGGGLCPGQHMLTGPAAPQSWMALLRREIGHLHEKKDLPLDDRWAWLHPVPTPHPHVCNPVCACVCALLGVPPWESRALSCPLGARHWPQPELWVLPIRVRPGRLRTESLGHHSVHLGLGDLTEEAQQQELLGRTDPSVLP